MAQRFIKNDEFDYDVFVSHASEDKNDVARPLALALQKRGLRVWYDEFELRFGDDLAAALNRGNQCQSFRNLGTFKAILWQGLDNVGT